MSSHHIVREKQEPALLILGLDDFSAEHLGQLLEWSPTLIATPETAEKLNIAGIKIDMIITDYTNDELQSDVKLISIQNDGYAATALNFLTGNSYDAVNIITDEFFLEIYTPFTEKINLVIYTGKQKIYPIRSGYSKWKPASEEIAVLTTMELTTNGLISTGRNKFLTTHDGFFTLWFDAPSVFITENL